MKRALSFSMIVVFMILVLFSCSKISEIDNENNTKDHTKTDGNITGMIENDAENSDDISNENLLEPPPFSDMKITVINPDILQWKNVSAEKWVSENLDIPQTEMFKRTPNDIMFIGDTVYISFHTLEEIPDENGEPLIDYISTQVEKIENGERTIIYDCFVMDNTFWWLINDGENMLFLYRGNWGRYGADGGHEGKIIITYKSGETEIVDFSLYGENGFETYIDYGCDFLHLLSGNDPYSIVLVLTGGDKTRTLFLDFDENYNIKGFYQNSSRYPEISYQKSSSPKASHHYPEYFDYANGDAEAEQPN